MVRTERVHAWTFDRIPVTANKAWRAHFRARMRDLDSWKAHALAQCGRRVKFRGKVYLHVDVYRPKQQDDDNAAASAKLLLDALRYVGWLEDDDPDHLSLELHEHVERCKARHRTEVRWTPLKEAER